MGWRSKSAADFHTVLPVTQGFIGAVQCSDTNKRGAVQALQGSSYSPPIPFISQAWDLLILHCATHSWDLQWLLELNCTFQQLILLPNHIKLPKLEQFSQFISGLAKHNVSHFHFDTTRCLALIHYEMETAFLSRVSLSTFAGGDPSIFLTQWKLNKLVSRVSLLD